MQTYKGLGATQVFLVFSFQTTAFTRSTQQQTSHIYGYKAASLHMWQQQQMIASELDHTTNLVYPQN